MYQQSLYKRSDESTGPSSEVMMESGPSGLASTSVSSVLSTVNAIPACTPTLCVADRAGKCPYFVVKVLYSIFYFFGT